MAPAIALLKSSHRLLCKLRHHQELLGLGIAEAEYDAWRPRGSWLVVNCCDPATVLVKLMWLSIRTIKGRGCDRCRYGAWHYV